MLSFTDQAGHTIQLSHKPRRIISLVPSQTELLFDLGLNEEVVGITKFCVHPQQWFHNKPKVGGTKQVKMDVVKLLNPDLIIANKEENVKEQVEELSLNYPVWTSDVNNPEDAYEMITEVGAITARERNALLLINKIKSKFSQLPAAENKPRAAYLVWRDPYMIAGSGTFIHSMMEAAGFTNMFADRKRYPEITVDDLFTGPGNELNSCQLLLLPSEPFPFKQKHVDELQPLLPGTKIILVDGEMFSWYGSRLTEAPGYFMKLNERIKK